MAVKIDAFRFDKNDPLAAEHALIDKILSKCRFNKYTFEDVDLTAAPGGDKILNASQEESTRLADALVARVAYFDRLARDARAAANPDDLAARQEADRLWDRVWPARFATWTILRQIMRKKLPFNPSQLVQIAKWISDSPDQGLADMFYPLKPFVKAIRAAEKIAREDENLNGAVKKLITVLKKQGDKDSLKLVDQLEELLGVRQQFIEESSTEATATPGIDASKPAPVGNANVLVALKQFLGILPANQSNHHVVGLDRFALPDNSPLRSEHEAISDFLPNVIEGRWNYRVELLASAAGKELFRKSSNHTNLTLALAERSANTLLRPTPRDDHRAWQSEYAVREAFQQIAAKVENLSRDELFDLLLYFSAVGHQHYGSDATVVQLLNAASAISSESLTLGERHVLLRMRCYLTKIAPFARPNEEVLALGRAIGDGACLALVPGEAMSDAINAELTSKAPSAQAKWIDLLRHASTATSSRPSGKWTKSAQERIKAIGANHVSNALLRWFPLINQTRTIKLLERDTALNSMIHEDNATCLRGLLWMAPEFASPEMIRAIGALTVSAYKKVPGVGPRAVKAGNAGVYALSQIDDPLAVGQLALLKIKVKFGSAQKEIEKAFNQAAERSGLPREELEEMAVPSYGLTDVGICEEEMGDFTARLTVTGTDSTELTWISRDGKTQKAVPAKVKETHKEDLKDLQGRAKDIQKMLPAQRERIDGTFLHQRVWPVAAWRERYLDHPLVGMLARRLLWDFTIDSKTITGIWFNGRVVDIDLAPVSIDAADTTVRMWHPISKNTDEVKGWRDWLDAQQIQQPFKQAHREIYIITEAELRTRTYSNRYAAHVLKQHQFNALCAARGWKNQLRLMVDADYAPPSLFLPQWNLRAEFWVEGIGDSPSDSSDSGAFLRFSTDQVRFYRVDAGQRVAHALGGGYAPDYLQRDPEPLPLSEIPPLVFSEVMRDVDLFVGVASIGNDPSWSDGGAEGRFHAYWQNYSFGALNETAKTRQDVLQRLIPKLKIAKVCSFEDKFLVVKGTIRTYRIHLGSGNILMEPNDQYLCIVPKPGAVEDQTGVMLPFEGDRTLSIILSKAFLLAADNKITDETILRQIKP